MNSIAQARIAHIQIVQRFLLGGVLLSGTSENALGVLKLHIDGLFLGPCLLIQKLRAGQFGEIILGLLVDVH